MHIAMKPNAAPIGAQPHPLSLKHHDFLKQEVNNLFNARIIHKSMSPWEGPIVIVKKHTWEGAPQQFHLCMNYRKVNSILPGVTPVVGTKKGTLTLLPLPKIDELFTLLKGAKYFTALAFQSGYYHIKLDKESIPRSAFDVLGKFEFL